MKPVELRSIALIALVSLFTTPVFADWKGASREAYEAELEKIDALAREQKWKPAGKRARKLATTIVQHSWYDKDLEKLLAEVSFQQAASLANLDQRETAIWYWHIAQNLDFRIRQKDLTPYGEASKLLREFPLRAVGEVPAGFRTHPHTGRTHSSPPSMPRFPAPKILTNTGSTIDRPGDFKVELVIDEQGAMHHPVVLSPHLHPIVIYFVLESILDFPNVEPATFDGEPVDCLFDLVVRFTVQRW